MARVEKILDKTDFTSTKELSKILESRQTNSRNTMTLYWCLQLIVPEIQWSRQYISSPLHADVLWNIANHVFKIIYHQMRLLHWDGRWSCKKHYDYNGTTAPYKTVLRTLRQKYFFRRKIPFRSSCKMAICRIAKSTDELCFDKTTSLAAILEVLSSIKIKKPSVWFFDGTSNLSRAISFLTNWQSLGFCSRRWYLCRPRPSIELRLAGELSGSNKLLILHISIFIDNETNNNLPFVESCSYRFKLFAKAKNDSRVGSGMIASGDCAGPCGKKNALRRWGKDNWNDIGWQQCFDQFFSHFCQRSGQFDYTLHCAWFYGSCA